MTQKSLLVLGLSLLILTGCHSPSTQLVVVNSSSLPVVEVYLDQMGILPSNDPLASDQSRTFDCLANTYDITIVTKGFRCQFESVQIKSGHTTTLIIMDPILGEPPPVITPPLIVVYEPSNLVTAVIHFVTLDIDWTDVII